MTTNAILPTICLGMYLFFFSPEYKDPFDLDINSESVLNECIMLFLSGPTESTLISLSTL